jgi:hypothetical protein
MHALMLFRQTATLSNSKGAMFNRNQASGYGSFVQVGTDGACFQQTWAGLKSSR